MGESYFWKPFAQGVATPVVLIGGTNLLLKDFKVSNPYLYWGGLAASSALVVGILADKIKVPILNAETFEAPKDPPHVIDGKRRLMTWKELARGNKKEYDYENWRDADKQIDYLKDVQEYLEECNDEEFEGWFRNIDDPTMSNFAFDYKGIWGNNTDRDERMKSMGYYIDRLRETKDYYVPGFYDAETFESEWVVEAVQQNLNDKDFVNDAYKVLIGGDAKTFEEKSMAIAETMSQNANNDDFTSFVESKLFNTESFEAQGKPTWAGYCPFCKKWRTTEWSKKYGGDTVCAKGIPDPHYNSGEEALFGRENFARKGGKWIRPKENICGVVLEKKQSKNAETFEAEDAFAGMRMGSTKIIEGFDVEKTDKTSYRITDETLKDGSFVILMYKTRIIPYEKRHDMEGYNKKEGWQLSQASFDYGLMPTEQKKWDRSMSYGFNTRMEALNFLKKAYDVGDFDDGYLIYDAESETFNSDSHTDSFMADMPVNAVRNEHGDGWTIDSVHRRDYKETFKNWKPSKYPYEKRITQDSVDETCNSCGKENVHYQFYLPRTNSVNPKIRFIDDATYCQYDPNTCGGNICGDCAQNNDTCENCGAEICSFCEEENNYEHSDLVCVDCREFNESLEDD